MPNAFEEEGPPILNLNIGNPAPSRFEKRQRNPQDGYSQPVHRAGLQRTPKGLFSARKRVMHYSRPRNICRRDHEDIYLGNGVSECPVMSMQGLLNNATKC